MEGMKQGEISVVDTKPTTKGLLEKSGDVLVKILSSPERATELLAAQIMMALEISHDMSLYPSKYFLKPEQVGQQPTEPMARWAMDHIGDIWEISAGHTALRLGFFALNQVLKTDKAIELQKKLLKNDEVSKLVSKFVESDRVEELAKGEEIQISDDACFWASLMTTVTIKAVHSMGWISLFGIHDHMDNPVPGMLFGQGVAAVVLATTHYTAKYHESIKDLALRVGRGAVKGGKSLGGRVSRFGEKIVVNVDNSQARMATAFENLNNSIDDFQAKLESWDPASSIPAPEAIIRSLLDKRVLKPKMSMTVEHDDD
jgi:hypothetical protein